jgi:pimeloyl-ACP methyl ester carboxylesterase
MLLRDQLYAGLVDVPEYGVRDKRGDFDPLISEDLFYRVQSILSGRVPSTAPRQRAHPDFPLRGFTVVQWDQRGAGRTLGKNPDAPPQAITVARMTQDGVELADLLRKQLRKDKIILVGHSWGSILGVHMVKARPDLFYAFVGTGQVADSATSYPVAHGDLLRKAETLTDERAIRELREVGPPPYPDGRGYGSSASGRISSRARTPSSRPMVGFALAATLCAMSTTGSTVRVSVPSAWSRKRVRSTRERSPATSLFRFS